MPQSTDNPFVIIMLVIIIILGIAITLLANVVLNAARYRAEHPEPDPSSATPDVNASTTTASATSKPAGGETPDTPALAGIGASLAIPAVNGLSDTAFYLIVGVIATEVFVIMALLYNLRVILGKQRKPAAIKAAPASVVPRASWWDRFNKLKPIAQEADLDLGHDYDGIRELDNRLPPWWLYGFYCSILFAGVYLWRYHIAHTAPLPAEEYRIAVHEAELRKADYLKKAANNVDENTVKQLSAPADLAAGRAVFESTCFPCHGKQGEGGVGPNLTDEYWLHGGSINSIFKTVKYGWPDKGMKSWKDDYSPSQIAQIASYVISLGGTHPPNPKPPQGSSEKQ